MPIYTVQGPDGKVFDIEGPDGATADQLARVAATYKKPPQEKPNYDPTGTFAENTLAGAGKAVADTWLGLKQLYAPVADFVAPRDKNLSGLITGEDNSRTAEVQKEVNEARKRDAPLMKTWGGNIGNLGGNVGMTFAAPGTSTVKGAAAMGGVMGAVQPTAEGESRLANIALGSGFGAGGQYLGTKVGQYLGSKLAQQTAQNGAQQAQNAGRDAALAAGQAEGYVLPRRMVGDQGFLTSLLEGFGGKIKLEQLASNKNQAVTNRLARQELGLADDAVLDSGVLNNIRDKAGQVYDAVSKVPQINSTAQYQSAINAIQQKFAVFQSKFPQLANKDIDPLLEAMRQGSFTGQEAVEFVKQLRQSGNLNSSVANTVKSANEVRNLGRAQLAAADAMDDLISQNLAASGNKALFDAYQNARVTIAKTHTIENAMDNTGNVSARRLLDQLEGKPYGGKLKTAADFAGAFPKAAQDVAKVEPYSVVDAGMMALLGTGGGLPAAAIPLARPAARSMALSNWYQGMNQAPKYNVSDLLRLAEGGINNPLVQRLAGPAAVAGYVQQ